VAGAYRLVAQDLIEIRVVTMEESPHKEDSEDHLKGKFLERRSTCPPYTVMDIFSSYSIFLFHMSFHSDEESKNVLQPLSLSSGSKKHNLSKLSIVL
jgi:hypothetical protein